MTGGKSLKRFLKEGDNEKEVGRHWHRRIISLRIAECDFLSFPLCLLAGTLERTFPYQLIDTPR